MICMVALLIAASLASTGCATRQSPQAKAQTGSNEFRDFNLGTLSGRISDDPAVLLILTNDSYAVADKAALIKALNPQAYITVGDIYLLEQVMSADAGDGETVTQSPTFTPTTTTDIQPATGTDAISALVGAGAEGLVKGIKSTGDDNAGAAAVVDPNCPDGNCADPAPK